MEDFLLPVVLLVRFLKIKPLLKVMDDGSLQAYEKIRTTSKLEID